MAYWYKYQILSILNAKQPLHFVESTLDIVEYDKKKMYAIEKDSPLIKELIHEGKLPVDNRILVPRPGYYHIIDIQLKDVEFKSETRQVEVGYALYKEEEEDKEYWNKIYQIKMKPLSNKVSEESYGKHSLQDLINRTICISRVELDENTHTYRVSWHEMESYSKVENDIAMAEHYMQQMIDREAALEYWLDQLDNEAEKKREAIQKEQEEERKAIQRKLDILNTPIELLDGFYPEDQMPNDSFDEYIDER